MKCVDRAIPPAVLAAMLSVSVVLPAPCSEEPAPADRDERLLRAELLEVSAADLDGAMAVYRELAADAAAPARIRARALLCLGRCHRKRAQLDAARRTLEELISAYPAEREAVRAARGFLREIQEGRAENPDFDWISEIQKSPEIQARVFDLAMELVDPHTADARRAAGQLVALGAIAVPVLERLIETSRDGLHRRRLALIAVESGRYERLDLLLGSGKPPTIEYADESSDRALAGFLLRVPDLPESERRRLLEVLDAIEVHPEAAPWAAMLRLLGGDREAPEDRLDLIEREPERLATPEIVAALLLAREDLVGAVSRRLLDRDRPIAVRQAYARGVERTRPEALTADHRIATIDDLPARDPVAQSFLREALRRGDFDVVAAVAPGKAQLVLGLFDPEARALRSNLPPGRGSPDGRNAAQIPAGWAAVLREVVLRAPAEEPHWRHLALGHLRTWAHSDDAAVPAYGDFLRDRPAGIPSEGQPGQPVGPTGWEPSPALAARLAGILAADDPVALALALETLARARAGVGPEILAAVEALLGRARDPQLRQMALYALLARLPERPETGPEVARLLEGEARRALDSGDSGDSGDAGDAGDAGDVDNAGDGREAGDGCDAGEAAAEAESPLPALSSRGWIGFSATGEGAVPLPQPGSRVPVRGGGRNPPGEPSRLEASWASLGATRGSRQAAEGFWGGMIAVVPHVLALGESEARAEVLRWISGTPHVSVIAESFAPGLAGIASREDRLLVLECLRAGSASEDSAAQVSAFLEAVAGDGRLPPEKRIAAVLFAVTMRHGVPEAFEWIEWAGLVREHPDALEELGPPFAPLAASTPRGAFLAWLRNLPAERRCGILRACLASEREGLRKAGTDLYPDDAPDFQSVLEAALADPAAGVRGAAADRIVEWAGRSARAAPLLVRLLALPERQVSTAVHNALRNLALPESIEPLARLLESQDPRVQELALASLKAIRERIEALRQWKDVLEELRAARSGTPPGGSP